MGFFKSIFGKKDLYSYRDEELTIENRTIEELMELHLPDYALVKKNGEDYWQRWGDLKKSL